MRCRLSFISFFLLVSSVAFATQEYIEEGRFGLEGTITSGGFQVGLVRVTDNFEFALDLDGITSSSNGYNSGDIGAGIRIGKRFNIGNFNYFSLGGSALGSLFVKNNGISNNGAFTVGPYIGFQRHFSGTNLMLTLYVLPIAYTYTPGFQDTVSVKTWQFAQTGGFGLAYLF